MMNMTNFYDKFCRFGLLALMSVMLCSCVTLPRNALPEKYHGTANVPDMPEEIRAYGISPDGAFQHDFAQAIVDGGPEAACDERDGQPLFCVLIISGGGGTGAYGAGVLNGWSASGLRPKFKIVTGISTGALTAPFAFLGSDWDEQLADAFRTINDDNDVFKKRGFFGILFKDSVAKVDPLKARIAGFVTPEMLDAVAREHRSGRRLYVGTTNMDSQELTVWNLGAIANSNSPNALELFRQVLLASASIPIAMPPVMMDVIVDGQIYDEMHADGGLQAQFFIPLVVINLPEAIAEARSLGFEFHPNPRMYIIRNAKFIPATKNVPRNLGKIAARTVDSMTQSMGRGDLYQIYAIAKARGTDFFYTDVPDSFEWESKYLFDGPQMRRLYDVGYVNGLSEDTWRRSPPGLFAINSESIIQE